MSSSDLGDSTQQTTSKFLIKPIFYPEIVIFVAYLGYFETTFLTLENVDFRSKFRWIEWLEIWLQNGTIIRQKRRLSGEITVSCGL